MRITSQTIWTCSGCCIKYSNAVTFEFSDKPSQLFFLGAPGNLGDPNCRVRTQRLAGSRCKKMSPVDFIRAADHICHSLWFGFAEKAHLISSGCCSNLTACMFVFDDNSSQYIRCRNVYSTAFGFAFVINSDCCTPKIAPNLCWSANSMVFKFVF